MSIGFQHFAHGFRKFCGLCGFRLLGVGFRHLASSHMDLVYCVDFMNFDLFFDF